MRRWNTTQQLVISVIAGPAVISNSEMVGKEVEYVRAQQSQPVSDPVLRCSRPPLVIAVQVMQSCLIFSPPLTSNY